MLETSVDGKTEDMARESDDRQTLIVFVNAFMVVCAVVAVTFRLGARRLVRAKLWWDDRFIILALVSVSIIFYAALMTDTA